MNYKLDVPVEVQKTIALIFIIGLTPIEGGEGIASFTITVVMND